MIWKQLSDLKLERGHSFLGSLLTPCGLVIDAGAHRCEFANSLAERYGTCVIALEPNAKLRPVSVHPRVTLLRTALATEDGKAAFAVHPNPEASTLIGNSARIFEETHIIPTRSLSSLVNQYKAPELDLLKLDIEGSEYDVLMRSPNNVLRSFKQISVEFHPHNAKTYSDVAKIKHTIERVIDLGFQGIKCSLRGYGDFLFVNSYHRSSILPLVAPYMRKINDLLA